jgi:hypothetical protein
MARKIQPRSGVSAKNAGGDREIEHRCDEHHAPADAVGEPAPEPGAGNGPDAGRQENDGALAVRQLPRPDDEGQHEADHEVIVEFQHVAEDGGKHDASLIASQLLLSIQELQHDISPFDRCDLRRCPELSFVAVSL